MLVKEHSEVRPLVAEYVQMTLLEKLRWRARQKEKDRRDAWAAREYIKDEGREEGRAEILDLLDQGYTPEQIKAKLTGTP
jgi:hypothetical protein